MMDEVIKKLCSFSELLQTLCKNIQRSRYEKLIIELAIAYDGYHFYLPAFLDFRGRIYRCGILHFHERDLARSLILFADSKSMADIQMYKRTFLAVTAFHYKSFVSVDDALEWFDNSVSDILSNLLEFAREAKRPFQFLANINANVNNKINVLTNIPITQDLSLIHI